mmetsp:Transcript_9942/g.14984  ORF Transcript_9942/g.14984 Transcript_9942/m.14984 type:complete len:581 (-) Transcript_9942:171-1913(-)|eukprot:CAMPEP_0185035464 /NCGR_PEP_ID=MMETSP1103-20130426/26879_1 /TAXON_ID=36769 /ORGANISM="Paraphysomonas bandaiensis, Strain Caron Lab Isolate" /LENGTH=580 /DNA_ID=CAMNT_0027572555 /DNA_START=217 /DNA_END=1959 /DNA_ORIENTATION=-
MNGVVIVSLDDGMQLYADPFVPHFGANNEIDSLQLSSMLYSMYAVSKGTIDECDDLTDTDLREDGLVTSVAVSPLSYIQMGDIVWHFEQFHLDSVNILTVVSTHPNVRHMEAKTFAALFSQIYATQNILPGMSPRPSQLRLLRTQILECLSSRIDTLAEYVLDTYFPDDISELCMYASVTAPSVHSKHEHYATGVWVCSEESTRAAEYIASELCSSSPGSSDSLKKEEEKRDCTADALSVSSGPHIKHSTSDIALRQAVSQKGGRPITADNFTRPPRTTSWWSSASGAVRWLKNTLGVSRHSLSTNPVQQLREESNDHPASCLNEIDEATKTMQDNKSRGGTVERMNFNPVVTRWKAISRSQSCPLVLPVFKNATSLPLGCSSISEDELLSGPSSVENAADRVRTSIQESLLFTDSRVPYFISQVAASRECLVENYDTVITNMEENSHGRGAFCDVFKKSLAAIHGVPYVNCDCSFTASTEDLLTPACASVSGACTSSPIRESMHTISSGDYLCVNWIDLSEFGLVVMWHRASALPGCAESTAPEEKSNDNFSFAALVEARREEVIELLQLTKHYLLMEA